MKIVGLTGGMGVGKSQVARLFEEKGYPVYSADIRAKELMEEEQELKTELIRLLGEEAYAGNKLNKKYIAEKIFSNQELLKKQNSLVHLAVKNDFEAWVARQKGNFCIKEAAILFESGSYKACDYTVVVTAPEEVRIQRILTRDNSTEEEIRKRLQNQLPQEKLIKLADFHIINDSHLEHLEVEVNSLIERLEEITGNRKTV